MSPRTIRQKLNYAALPNARAFEWAVFRANPLTVQLGVFRGTAADDLSDLTSITLKGRASLSSGTNIFSHTVLAASFGTITSGTWADGSAQHVEFDLTSANLNRAPVDDNFVALHVVITAIPSSGGDEITLGVGRLLIHEDNNGDDYPPEENAAGHSYVLGEISESGRSVIFHNADDEVVGWCALNGGTPP